MINRQPTDHKTEQSLYRTLSALANDCRRAVLRTLHTSSNRAMELDELVNRVCEELIEEQIESRIEFQREPVEIRLHHHHLPKLEHSGLIEIHDDFNYIQSNMSDFEKELLLTIEQYR